MIESTLDNIAEKILGLDEASLSSLCEKYRMRMEHFETSKEWEKSVIVFFIINAVRMKNQIFNEQLFSTQNKKECEKPVFPKGKPRLHLVK